MITSFKRGDVIEGNIPESIHTELTPRPGFFLYGKHKLVMLHDSDTSSIDSRLALVVPITSAKAEVTKAQREGRNILESYIPIDMSQHPFLTKECYISSAQIMGINREWLTEPVGKLHEIKLWELNYILLSNLGLMDTVQELALLKLQELYPVIGQAAAGSEEDK